MSTALNVSHVAQLARLKLSDAEIARFQEQLTQVLAYVEKLREVDVSGIEPTAHTNPVHNVFRADQDRPGLGTEPAMSNAPRSANHLFLVPNVIE